MAASYTFLPWVRQGVVSAIEDKDTAGAQLKSRVQIKVIPFVNNSQATGSPVTVRLYGPGDVTGFDCRREVIRTVPEHLTPDFEPHYFPFIEFHRPDFPHLFTPARANDNEQLRPWICLVVVEKREDNLKSGLSQGRSISSMRPLPFLQVNAKTELPNLAESWAWAHVQVSGSVAASELDNLLATNQERRLSRLLCPRKLKPNKSYYACVVPTFEVGRKAGLGEEVEDGENEVDEFLKPAWDINTGDIQLPVYCHWEFSTGAAGDFESLVWLLQRQSLSAKEVGTREVQVENPDPGDPQADPPRPPWPEIGEIPLEGALRPYQDEQQDHDDPLKQLQGNEDYKKFQEKLQALLNSPEDSQSSATLPPNLPIAPPIYGRWHGAQRTVPGGARDAAWLREINLNPSHRVAASIGTQIAQDQQEQLMASTWEQVGEIEKANQILRQAQLAQAASRMLLEQHLEVMSAEIFFTVTGPVHSRVLIKPEQALNAAAPSDAKTMFAITGDSLVPQTLAQGSFRHVMRPRGPLARRLMPYGGLNAGSLIRRLNNGTIQVVPPRGRPQGIVTMDEVFQGVGRTSQFCLEHLQQRLEEAMHAPSPLQIVNSLVQILRRLDQLLNSSDLPAEARELLLRARELLDQCRQKLQGLLSLSVADLKSMLDLLSASRKLLIEAYSSLASSSFELRNSVDELRAGLDSVIPPQEVQRLLFGVTVSEHLSDIEPCDPQTTGKPKLELETIKTSICEVLNPETTIKARVKALIAAPPHWNLEDKFEPIMVGPEFPTPMYKPLADLSQDLMLPGLEYVPPNTITLLETNPRFIEAYLVGLNHEMSRELLWREFPTDQRWTCFRQFWDPLGHGPPPTTPEEHEALKDIKPLDEWEENNALGTNMQGGNGKKQSVLLIRGDLLHRYPRPTVYAARAEWAKDAQGQYAKDSQGRYLRNPAKPERYPVFQGTLVPDIIFLGFDVPAEEAIGQQVTDKQANSPEPFNPGWFFILQEQFTEPRYGLDETPPDTLTGTWRDLSWPSVTLTASNYISLGELHDPKDSSKAYTKPTKAPDDSIGWASNSAAMAYITLQSSFRVAIHASDILPHAEPTITLDPTEGPPGTEITVTGSGWIPRDTIFIHFAVGGNEVAQATVGDDGSFVVSFIVPSDAEFGEQLVIAGDLDVSWQTDALFRVTEL